MRLLMLSALALTAIVLVLGGCSTATNLTTTTYWTRPGATLDQLATESEACYAKAVEAVEGEFPSAFPRPGAPAGLLPPTEPPPKLWARAPREAAFARFDEQFNYDRCMRKRGWTPKRA
jgi:hypothetical protein